MSKIQRHHIHQLQVGRESGWKHSKSKRGAAVQASTESTVDHRWKFSTTEAFDSIILCAMRGGGGGGGVLNCWQQHGAMLLIYFTPSAVPLMAAAMYSNTWVSFKLVKHFLTKQNFPLSLSGNAEPVQSWNKYSMVVSEVQWCHLHMFFNVLIILNIQFSHSVLALCVF